ncbi:unnamed protein product [Soboliphyme baturini]|uniref:EF-hand domain-containing protein n=1 Tax=Soboliphyme baturini TaxID=241478 RepID=A0A183J1R3_9BILA|nr:unnamed protein product [Soboliphyme baturini]
MFLKLKDLTTSQAFLEFDTNKDGWISPKEFQRAMEGQKMYSIEEINYLMMCTDVNNDGKIDYMEFTERFHNPAKDIGFNLAVLLTNLKEHISGDNRLDPIFQTASAMCEYFDQYLGRIEIMGSSKRVEKVYFEIKEEWLEQFNKPQIKQSKKDFLFNVMQSDGGEQGKLEAFVNFCEDTIFEMSHAAEISTDDQDSRIERAKRQREIFMGSMDKPETGMSFIDVISCCASYLHNGITFVYKWCRPSTFEQSRQTLTEKMKTMTYAQMFRTSCSYGFKFGKSGLWLTYFFVATLLRFLFYLMGGTKEDEEATLKPLSPLMAERRLLPKYQALHQLSSIDKPSTDNIEAFGISLTYDNSVNLLPQIGETEEQSFSERTSMLSASEDENANVSRFLSPVPPGVQFVKEASENLNGRTQSRHPSVSSQPMSSGPDYPEYMAVYEPKIAETLQKSKVPLSGILARNFFVLKYITLGLAFFINAILLFYRVSVNAAEIKESFMKPGIDTEFDNASMAKASSAVAEVEELVIHENYYYLNHVLIGLSLSHCLVSLALLIAYYQLKVICKIIN